MIELGFTGNWQDRLSLKFNNFCIFAFAPGVFLRQMRHVILVLVCYAGIHLWVVDIIIKLNSKCFRYFHNSKHWCPNLAGTYYQGPSVVQSDSSLILSSKGGLHCLCTYLFECQAYKPHSYTTLCLYPTTTLFSYFHQLTPYLLHLLLDQTHILYACSE